MWSDTAQAKCQRYLIGDTLTSLSLLYPDGRIYKCYAPLQLFAGDLYVGGHSDSVGSRRQSQSADRGCMAKDVPAET